MAHQKVIKAVLIDLSGTLHVENAAIPGATEALKRLYQSRWRCMRFISSTDYIYFVLISDLRAVDYRSVF